MLRKKNKIIKYSAELRITSIILEKFDTCYHIFLHFLFVRRGDISYKNKPIIIESVRYVYDNY